MSPLAGIVGKLERDFADAADAGNGLDRGRAAGGGDGEGGAAGEPLPYHRAVLTGSERMEGSVGRRELRLGKLHVVSNLQALLQQGRIGLPRTSEAGQLAQELLDFELRVNENANLISAAFRTGAHDDLVVALGLSCLENPRKREVGVSSVSPWS